jgi:hypothetical protein
MKPIECVTVNDSGETKPTVKTYSAPPIPA